MSRQSIYETDNKERYTLYASVHFYSIHPQNTITKTLLYIFTGYHFFSVWPITVNWLNSLTYNFFNNINVQSSSCSTSLELQEVQYTLCSQCCESAEATASCRRRNELSDQHRPRVKIKRKKRCNISQQNPLLCGFMVTLLLGAPTES